MRYHSAALLLFVVAACCSFQKDMRKKKRSRGFLIVGFAGSKDENRRNRRMTDETKFVEMIDILDPHLPLVREETGVDLPILLPVSTPTLLATLLAS